MDGIRVAIHICAGMILLALCATVLEIGGKLAEKREANAPHRCVTACAETGGRPAMARSAHYRTRTVGAVCSCRIDR